MNDLGRRFGNNPNPDNADAHTSVRQHCRNLADLIDASVPDSREKSLAVTRLEEVMFWWNAAVAREGASEAAPAPKQAKP